MKKIVLIFIFIASGLFAQTQENLKPVPGIDGEKVYIDTKGLDKFTGPDIFVWTVKWHTAPLIIESVNEKIYKTKTYYVYNKELNRYSLMEIVYYDKSGKVIQDFSYDAKKGENGYRYNYPVIPGTEEDKIFKTAVEVSGAE